MHGHGHGGHMHMHSHHHGRGGGGAPGSIVNIVVMFGVGALLAVMGVVFVVIAQSVRLLRSSFTLTGGILAAVGVGMVVIGVFMLRSRANAQRLRAEGIPGQAQIVGLQQTSMYINGQPVVELQLHITTGMSAPYLVTRRETVPMIMMGLLTSGRPLPIKVDRARPDNLVILWESALSPPAGVGAPPAAWQR